MIVVTGATGNVGSWLLRSLREGGVAARAVTREPRRAVVPAGVELAQGDLLQPSSLAPALQGAEGLFLLMSAGALTQRVDLDAVLRLAREAGVKRVVLVSSLLAQTHPRSMPGRISLEAEEKLRTSGLGWTILRPWELASNTLAWVPAVREKSAVQLLTAGVPSPVIHPADIAAVAFRALTEPGHEGRTYALTGPEALRAEDKVRAIGAAIGRELAFVVNDDPKALEALERQAPDPEAAKVMLPGICGLQSPGPLPTVEQVTGNRARPFQQWANEHARAFA